MRTRAGQPSDLRAGDDLSLESTVRTPNRVTELQPQMTAVCTPRMLTLYFLDSKDLTISSFNFEEYSLPFQFFHFNII